MLLQVMDSLEACEGFSESRLFIFSDGPKNIKDSADVGRVRSLIRARLRPNITLVESDTNLGLDPSILRGVSRLINEFGRVIVLEDDLIVAPQLLLWFNAALEKYADEPEVMQIAGHILDASELRQHRQAVTFPFPTSWGWATWSRAWAQFDPDAKGWETLQRDRALRRRFNLEGAYDYDRTLRANMFKPSPQRAWDIRWYWSIFKADGLCLFPPQTLVLNVGMDGKATHGHLRHRLYNIFNSPQRLSNLMPDLPDRPKVNDAEYAAIKRAIKLRRY